MKQNPEPARARLAQWLRAQQKAGLLRINLDADKEPRDFDCFLCGLNYNLHSTKKLHAAAFVAAHVKKCTLSYPRAP